VGLWMAKIMRPNRQTERMGGGDAEKDKAALYFIRSLNSSAVKSASFRMLFRIFGWRIFPEWYGMVILVPSSFLKILWLPLCLARKKPALSKALMASSAETRGSLSVIRPLQEMSG